MKIVTLCREGSCCQVVKITDYVYTQVAKNETERRGLNAGSSSI